MIGVISIAAIYTLPVTAPILLGVAIAVLVGSLIGNYLSSTSIEVRAPLSSIRVYSDNNLGSEVTFYPENPQQKRPSLGTAVEFINDDSDKNLTQHSEGPSKEAKIALSKQKHKIGKGFRYTAGDEKTNIGTSLDE